MKRISDLGFPTPIGIPVMKRLHIRPKENRNKNRWKDCKSHKTRIAATAVYLIDITEKLYL